MKWQVQVHGGPKLHSFEISVINFEQIGSHQKHYGWFNHNKLLISSSGSGNYPVSSTVWARLMRVAQETADELNGINKPVYYIWKSPGHLNHVCLRRKVGACDEHITYIEKDVVDFQRLDEMIKQLNQ